MKSKKTYTALEVYKAPFECFGSHKIFTADGNMALDIVAKCSQETIDRIVGLLNGSSTEYTTNEVTTDDGYILIDGRQLLLVRGWGHLTGSGGLRLDPDVAAKIQDEFAEWVTLKLQGKDEESKQ